MSEQSRKSELRRAKEPLGCELILLTMYVITILECVLLLYTNVCAYKCAFHICALYNVCQHHYYYCVRACGELCFYHIILISYYPINIIS